ncbi:MAG: hypothetical protein GY870_14870, partial [archaeon]|nr:hypothetical protein [archaeon]
MENTDSNKKEEIKNEFQLIETTSIDDDIYDRQKRLKGWNQVELQNAHVLVIGAGATGNELIKNLIMVGIGEITIIDFDF